ncbi:hypothetical protein SSX86_011622 [Deinandra increscens subsp. villosa]|uniref:DUF4378 domain-containing protein n=1 Tax=Deinandra increscens subsp. villosa TaxID=3103831 RepID=A0AAP0D2M0_9ASTR
MTSSAVQRLPTFKDRTTPASSASSSLSLLDSFASDPIFSKFPNRLVLSLLLSSFFPVELSSEQSINVLFVLTLSPPNLLNQLMLPPTHDSHTESPGIQMSWIQSGKSRNPEKPISGCLGRMVNLFDLNTSVGGNKLLTDRPHHDGSSFSRRHSDVTRTSLDDDDMYDKVIVSDLRKSPSNRNTNGTPIKMLIAQEMSKEEDSKQSPSNLVAKLMGLDAMPHQHQLGTASRRSRSGSLEFLQQENGFVNTQSKHEINQYQEQGEYKDVYEICQNDSPQKGKCGEKQKMALVREKFMEAKRLSTDEKLRQTKQFQDALEVLSSNKDTFLKFLQEPNSLFSQNIYNLQSVPPPPESRRITILKPSKLVDNEKHVWNKKGSDVLFSPECCKIDDDPNQPTRIVVLKPSSVKPHNIKVVSSSLSNSTSHDDVFDGDPEEIATEVSDNLSRLRRDETLISSVFSNGYIGDDSSYCKSEIDYATGNLSDSEAVSPVSRHSWDYINRFNSNYRTSSSRTSYSPESSVCREAKKRLSERWAMMSLNKNDVVEQRHIQRSSSTLGDMLALSDLKKSVKPEENHETIDLNKAEDADRSSRNLVRSKSVSALPDIEVSGSLKDKADDPKDVVKEKLVKSSSFKGRVSSLFFSKNKKSSKEKSHQSNDAPQSTRFPPKNVGIEGSQCINDMSIEEASCSGLQKSVFLPEVGFSFTKLEFPGNHIANQDQPSPVSVLEPQFEEDDHTASYHHNSKLNKYGMEPMKYNNLIDKSPPIGSIARTLSWDDSAGSATPYSSKPSSTPLNPEEEEQECLFYVQTLLSVAGLSQIRSNSFLGKWYSPESPLDPSLRDKYMNLSQKEPILDQTKPKHHRAITKLVFDCVNEALIDIAGHGPYSRAHNVVDMAMSSTTLVDRVCGQIKEWIWLEERCDWEDGDGGCGGMVVMKEVVGKGWVEGLGMEVDNTRMEIERKLLEELVQESVLELTGRA